MIADRLIAYDPITGARLPVQKWEIAAFYRERHDRAALRIVQRLPDVDGVLDAARIDALLLRCADEMQGLLESVDHGARVAAVLRPLAPARVVDVRCGNGYVVRYLAKQFGETTDLIGCEPQAALCQEASKLAKYEGLKCRFETADPFSLDAQVVISTGFLQRLDEDELRHVFRKHEASGVRAFVHFNWRRRPSGFGLHEALARYDARSYKPLPDEYLKAAALAGAPGFTTKLLPVQPWSPFQTIVGERL